LKAFLSFDSFDDKLYFKLQFEDLTLQVRHFTELDMMRFTYRLESFHEIPSASNS